MARHLQTIDEWEEWVPGVDNERELYADGEEAIVMEIRHLTKEQQDYYKRVEEKYRRQGAVTKALDKSLEEMFSENVRNIRGYSIDEELIESGEDLYKRGEEDIKMKVTEAFYQRSALDGGLAKKLRSPSVSTSSPKKSADGVALSATLTSPPITLAESTSKTQSSA